MQLKCKLKKCSAITRFYRYALYAVGKEVIESLSWYIWQFQDELCPKMITRVFIANIGYGICKTAKNYKLFWIFKLFKCQQYQKVQVIIIKINDITPLLQNVSMSWN